MKLAALWAALKKVGVVVAALLALAAIAFVLIHGLLQGSKTITLLAVVLGLAPVVLYIATKWPIIFPVCFYILFIPFDNLLGVSQFGTVTKLLAILSGIALAFWLIRHKQANRVPISVKIWGILLFWMSLSVLWAIDPTLSGARLISFTLLFLLYLALAVMPAKLRDLKAMLLASVVGGVVAAGYGTYLFYHGLGLILKRLIISNGQDAIDPNHFAAALILPVAVVTVFALRSNSLLRKLALVAVDIVFFAGIYASGSRGGMLAIGVVFAFIFWKSRHRFQMFAVAAAGLAGSFFMPVSVWARFSNALSTGGAGRVSIWRVGWDAFKHHWLIGAGIGNFPAAYDKSFLNVFESYYTNWHRVPHNLFVSTSVELGIVGMAIVLVAWGSQFALLNRIDRRSELYDFALIAQASVLGVFTAAIFLDVMYEKYTWLIFVVGVMTYALWQAERQGQSGPSPSHIDLLAEANGHAPLPSSSWEEETTHA